jgi:hypothetical protein
MLVFMKCANCDRGFNGKEICTVCNGRCGKDIMVGDWCWYRVGVKPRLRLHCIKHTDGMITWTIKWRWGFNEYQTWSYEDLKKTLYEARQQMMHEFHVKFMFEPDGYKASHF